MPELTNVNRMSARAIAYARATHAESVIAQGVSEPATQAVIMVPEAARGPFVAPPKERVDLRLWDWTARQVLQPQKFTRWASWWLRLYPRITLFAATVLGGRVSADVYRKRMEVCGTCDRHLKRIVKTEPTLATKSYCLQCGCPEWALSRLDRKNRFAGWKCPKRLHPGPYPEDAYKDFVTINAPPRKGGCGGGNG